MKYFVFRNYTVEPFFGYTNYEYSGYDDISVIPESFDSYIWFYQVPIKFDRDAISDEIKSFSNKLRIITQHIKEKNILVFSLTNLWDCKIADNDYRIEDAIIEFNQYVKKMALSSPNIHFVDFDNFLQDYPKDQIVSWKYYFISQTILNTKLAKDFQKWFRHIEEKIALKRKKCIVLDLDNTLWGGILGEDGIDGIKIGGDYPGNAFMYWQSALLELSKSGIILAVCSKNNEKDVLEVWEKNPFMILRKEHFSAWKINWKDKASNIKDLSKELNIGMDSMIFIDDNPSERDLIKQALPMIAVPDFPHHPYELLTFYKLITKEYFQIYTITEEDRVKTEQYKAMSLREKEKELFLDMDSYLESLQLSITIMPLNDFNITRIAQMTQKTNQFNLTTQRFSESDIRQMANRYRIYCIGVKDKFGDNGITGCIFMHKTDPKTMVFDNLLLSCRILGKGIEQAFVAAIVNNLIDEGFMNVTSQYIPSSKNKQTESFYESLGFKVTNIENGVKTYNKLLEHKLNIKKYYNIIEKV